MPEAEIDLAGEASFEGTDATAPYAAPVPEPEPSVGARWLADPVHGTALPRTRALRAPRLRSVPRAGRRAAAAVGFAAGALGVMLLFVAVAMGIAVANTDRVLPGVRVGAVDVSGLTREEAVDKLRNAYSHLAQGEVEIVTPSGSATVAYGLIGRAPDAEAMADAALQAGRTGNLLGDAVTTWRSAIAGQDIPVVIRIDPEAVSVRVRQLTLTSLRPPRDAEATLFYDTFVYWPSAQGSAVDEDAVSQAIVGHLTDPNAPARFQVGSALITLKPNISDDEAEYAIEIAERMTVDVTLTLGSGASPSPAQSPTKTAGPVKTFIIPAASIRNWIVFGVDASGEYGPSLDQDRVKAYVASLPGSVIVPPVEPRVVFDATGVPVSLAGGQDGIGVDAAATARAIGVYLLSLARGGSQQASIELAVGPIAPRITGSLTGLTILGGGDGAWTTVFYPGETNGDGLNIRTPAATLNGQIVPPGAQFSFLKAVGPIDAAHGYTWGGVIVRGKSDHTGAMGGGICSASTTMFNAALRAGLQIDERTAHAYYIDRYPAGFDATVYAGGSQVTDLRWTNDTPNPIVIRAWATNKAKSTITIQLWSLPLDRAVVLNLPEKKNVVKAGDSTVYVSTLPPGEKYRAEYPTAGFDIVRTRTVFDEDGTLLHSNSWRSHYVKVDGILQIGGAAPTPTPTPTPTAIFTLPALVLLRGAATIRRKLHA